MCSDNVIRIVTLTRRKAKKPYSCFECDVEILPGEEYISASAIIEESGWGRG